MSREELEASIAWRVEALAKVRDARGQLEALRDEMPISLEWVQVGTAVDVLTRAQESFVANIRDARRALDAKAGR